MIRFYKNRANRDSKKTWRFFKTEGIPRSNVYSYIKKYGEFDKIEFKTLSCRSAMLETNKVKNRIKFFFKNKPSTLTAVAIARLSISKSYLCQIKAHKYGIKARTKKLALNYKLQQKNRINECCQSLLKKLCEKVVLLDDESYVLVDASNVSKAHFYHSSNPSEGLCEEKVRKKVKRSQKYSIW